MISVPLTLRFFVATGTAAVLVGCSSGGDQHDTSAAEPPSPAPTSSPTPTEDTTKQTYLDAVNALCEDLLPKVVAATHGGSLDVSAAQYLSDWPAHLKLLDGFDRALGQVPVPPAAADAAAAMSAYIVFADRLDDARLAAARKGEAAWQQEVAAEADAEDDPTIAARTAAGFDESCDAR